MSKWHVLAAGLGKALSHMSNDPNASPQILVIVFVLIIIFALYEVVKFLESL